MAERWLYFDATVTVTDPDEAARRARAARAYARLTRAELAARCGLTAGQLKLLEDGRRRVTTRSEMCAIGDACGVPSEFMDGGFEAIWIASQLGLVQPTG
jgi:transcriptional regulator with XRE-family HTH domain